MEPNYVIREFEIEELYVNPDNARFINSDELPDELAAIEELVSMKNTHIDRLAKDIAKYGLNPNELPIVIPSEDSDGRYLVMDGNRRIASIKLMTQYRKELGNMEIKEKKSISSLHCEIKSVTCVLYEKEEDINYLIEKLHTSKPGVSQVKWDPQAQDRHQSKNSGLTSKRLALIEILRFSKYTPRTVKDILDVEGWTSKLQRFVSKKYIAFFGVEFDKSNNIILHLEESEVIKGLSQLSIDLKNINADLIAQTKEVRAKYLESFPIDKKPNEEKISNSLVIFDVKLKQFIISDIKNDIVPSENNVNIDNPSESKDSGSENKQPENQSGFSPEDESVNPGKENTGSENVTDHNNGKSNGKDSSDNDEGEKPPNSNSNNLKSTAERTTLIPKDENIPIKNQRTLDLYKELKMVNVNLYTNTVSIAFRSLLEFSLNCFLEKKGNKWAHNEQITLFKKLDKVIKILENEIGKPKLIFEIPAIYTSIESYNSSDKKNDINSITNLNIIIHSHNYHPTEKDLKNIYNNYSPLLKRIWEKI